MSVTKTRSRRLGGASALLSLFLVSVTFVPAGIVAIALSIGSVGARVAPDTPDTARDTTALFPGPPARAGEVTFPPPPPAPGGGGVLEDGVRTIFLERGPGLGISPMNVVYHPGFEYYYASNGGDPLWSAWVYRADGTRIQDLESIGVDVRAWNYNPNLEPDNGGSGLEILSFDAQDGDGGDERGLIHPGVDKDGLLNGETTNVLAELPGLIDRQSAPSYDPDRDVFYSRGLGTLVHVVSRTTGLLVDTFELDFEAAGVVDTDVLAWSLGYDAELGCVIAADHINDRALVFELDGSFVGASAIDMDINRMWGVAYTNGQFFLWSDKRNGWQGYTIKVEIESDPCSDCPCPADINRDGEVAIVDLIALLSAFGTCPENEAPAGGPSGQLLGLSSGEALYDIDRATGAATLLTALDADADGVGLSCLGIDVYGSDLALAGDGLERIVGRIDPVTGDTLFVSNQGSENWHGLASDHQGTGLLYSIDNDDEFALKSLDPKTGVVTSIGVTGIDGNGMAYDDWDGILYATHIGQGPTEVIGELFTVDTTTGVATFVGSTGVADLVRVGLAFDESTRVLYMNVSGEDNLYTLDVKTGAATLVGPNNVNDGLGAEIDGLAWRATEPCDTCPCAADVNRDGEVNIVDLVLLLASYGTCEPAG